MQVHNEMQYFDLDREGKVKFSRAKRWGLWRDGGSHAVWGGIGAHSVNEWVEVTRRLMDMIMYLTIVTFLPSVCVLQPHVVYLKCTL
jgi:hypothetical protein